MMQILSLNKLAIELKVPRKVLEDVASNKSNYYHPYIKKETKKDGSTKERRIDNPNKSIRQLQKRINKKILNPECKKLPEYMTGCIPGRSAVNNARPHKSSQAILAVDIANCFPSITTDKVYDVFRNKLNCSPPVAKVLTKLTTYGDRLPQGAPTSPSLCNLVLQDLSEKLHRLSQESGLTFTQYVDDLTFSGSLKTLSNQKPKIIRLVESYDFKVNPKKLKLSRSFERMEVTGLVVNKFLSVGRNYIRNVERDILRHGDETRIKGKISHIQSVSKTKSTKLKKKLKTSLDIKTKD